MTFTIRPLRLEDLTAFHRALDSVCKEKQFLLDPEAPPLEKLADGIKTHLDNGFPFAVAEQAGRITGWADITPYQRQSLKHSAKLGMGVVQGQRGRGIGEALLSQVVDQAAARGIVRIELEVLSRNLPAIGLYRKLGFELEGTKRCAALVDGNFLDMHFMARITRRLP